MSWVTVFTLHYYIEEAIMWATQVTVTLHEISSDSTYTAHPFKKNGHIPS